MLKVNIPSSGKAYVPSIVSTPFIPFKKIEKNIPYDLNVHCRDDMTVNQLINNFRSKLCDDSIIIGKFLLNDSVELSPTSFDPVSNYGINDKSVIKAFKQV